MYYPAKKNIILRDYLKTLASFIKDCQLESGAIISNADGSLDPWDHCESIMGLSIMNQFDSALKGFDWLKDTQNEDGSWYAKYNVEGAIEFHKPTHFSSYIAVAVFHYYLITNDKDFLKSLWGFIEKAIDFTLKYQTDDGSIYWAVDDKNNIDKDSLITGSSSILKSLECGIAISKILNKKNNWYEAYLKLRECIRNSPSSFDKKKDRSNFSMDSYYPVLCGAIDDKGLINNAINKTLQDFYVDGIGIKCVNNEPWVTVAETSEFIIALTKNGKDGLAKKLFTEILNISDLDNVPYMGWQYKENIFWPDEKPSWTAAAVILAADGIYDLSKGSSLFKNNFLDFF